MNGLRYLLSLTLLFTVACAARKGAEQAPAVQQSEGVAKPLTKEEMMAAFEKAATPSDGHKVLKPLVGNFTTTATSYYNGPDKPEVTKGYASNSWILGGRYIEENYSGKFMGKAFKGRGLLGYDNTRGKYFSYWADTMSTGIMTLTGSYDKDKNAITFSGEFSCPVTGQTMATRSVTTIKDNNNHLFEMFDVGPDGKIFKSLEIVYKRVKATASTGAAQSSGAGQPQSAPAAAVKS